MKLWNTHYIRKSRNEHVHVPHGRPDVIYYMPELFGDRDFLCQVDDTEVAAVSEILTVTPPMCQEKYAELFELLMLLMTEIWHIHRRSRKLTTYLLSC